MLPDRRPGPTEGLIASSPAAPVGGQILPGRVRKRIRGWILSVVGPAVLALPAAPLPTDLTGALAHFRAEGPKGWSFTQTTVAGGDSLVEHFDAAEPEYQAWTLVQKNGRAPTPEEAQAFRQERAGGSTGFNPPRIQDQLDVNNAELIRESDERSIWRFQLQPGGDDDKTARFMAVTITFHRPTRTIERVEIASLGPFSPVFGVKVVETQTVLDYSLPSRMRPSLLNRATLRIRGRAFWFKSLDQDMTVTFSDHAWAGKK